MNSRKIVNFAQIAFKMGKVAAGDQLIKSIQKKNAKIVIYSKSIGANRKKKITDKCSSYSVPCLELDDEDFNKISSRAINSFAVLDKGLADAMLKELKG